MAQIVSLETLKKLAAKPVAEADGKKPGSHFFWEFNDRFMDEIDSVHRQNSSFSRDKTIEQAYCKVRDGFLKENCPPVEYISEGSSRAAYALGGGLCLKVATSEKGCGQNEAEASNMEHQPKSGIFPILYEIGDECTSILVECVAPCKQSDAKEIGRILEIDKKKYPCVTDAISQLFEFVAEEMPGDFEAMYEMIADDTPDEVWRQIAIAILDPMNAAQRVLSDLARFTFKHSRQFDPADIAVEENWGFAVREGQVVPIVLDAGFSQHVRKTWYN